MGPVEQGRALVQWVHYQIQGNHCYFLRRDRQGREQQLPQRTGLRGA